MKFSAQWLKSHLQTTATLTAITERLTNLGLEVEEIIERPDLQGFVIAEIIEAKPHPDAQRLQVCSVMVNAAHPPLQIVCGAPNARKGLKTVLGLPGLVVPGNGLMLKKSLIRGVESQGMLCSPSELKLSSESDGIIELPTDAPIGTPFATYAGLDDPVIHIAITPNRADCSSVYGVARDLAASGLGTLTPIKTQNRPGSFKSPIHWQIDSSSQQRCPIVAGRYFRGLQNTPSPAWLQRRLQAIGQRPISALVDITNYLTHDIGRPLHVYDAKMLKGDLTMRLAKTQEKLAALDGQIYNLSSDDLIIADQQQVHGLAGIIGGQLAACQATTTEAFLEVAYFQPTGIARSGRRLNILSDARYRFERGIDPESVNWGMNIATQMILDICGGTASEIVTTGSIPSASKPIQFQPILLKQLGGLEVEENKIRQILLALGCKVEGSQHNLVVTPPSWRPDLQLAVDLVEEVTRIVGYHEIVPTPLPAFHRPNKPSINVAEDKDKNKKTARAPGLADMLSYNRQEQLKRLMVSRGFQEALTYSFIAPKAASYFGITPRSLVLTNPINADLSVMRPNLLPNLLDAVLRNQNRGIKDWAVFEFGPVFKGNKSDDQQLVLAALHCGYAENRHWLQKPRMVDVFDIKGHLFSLLQASGVSLEGITTETPAAGWYHPGRSGRITSGKTTLAEFGEIHPNILQAYDIISPIIAFELYYNALPDARMPQKSVLSLSPFQPVERDFAFVVHADIAAEKLLRAIRMVDKQLIRKVELFDVYSGKGLPDGTKSLAIGVILQAHDHTLTDTEINEVSTKILAAANKSTGAVLRQ